MRPSNRSRNVTKELNPRAIARNSSHALGILTTQLQTRLPYCPAVTATDVSHLRCQFTMAPAMLVHSYQCCLSQAEAYHEQ